MSSRETERSLHWYREPQHGGPDNAAKPTCTGKAIGIGGFNIAFWHRLQRAVKDFGGICSGIEEEHHQRTRPCRGEGRQDRVDLFERKKQEIGKKELDEQRRAAEHKDEPQRGLADQRMFRCLGQRQPSGKHKTRQKGQSAKIDVPQHARADQHHLLAQREIGSRQQTLADPEGAQAVIGKSFPAAHAAAFRWASPPKVAWPRVRRRMMRSSTISEARVKAR